MELEKTFENERFLPKDSQQNNSNKTKTTAANQIDASICLDTEEIRQSNGLFYSVEDVPPWYLCIFLGFQQALTAMAGVISMPILLHKHLCMDDDTVGLSDLIGTTFFTSGLSTVAQSTIGIRLPIVQGPTAAFMVPVFALMSQPEWRCPFIDVSEVAGIENSTGIIGLPEVGSEEHRAMWKSRLSVDRCDRSAEDAYSSMPPDPAFAFVGGLCCPSLDFVSGSLMVASGFQILVGLTGFIGLLLRFIGPITICAVTSSIGLALFPIATSYASQHWYIAVSVIVFLTVFSQYLKKWRFLQIFPVILSIGLSWLLCFALTRSGILTEDKDGWGYGARTDIKTAVLWKTSWFRFPYPGQFGWPTVNFAGVCGMLIGTISSVMESVGDYYACALQSGAETPPSHAINRGVAVEGLGCFLCGLWGSSNGTTSYSENIAAISITRVGSRRVTLVAGIIFLILGCAGKLSALFVTIPDPILGGLFHVTFGMVMTVGLSNLQFVNMSSPRNLFVVGVSICIGQTMPTWLNMHQSNVKTGNAIADQIIRVLLGTHMFVAGVVACFLDNTIPGTKEERGFTRWKKSTSSSTSRPVRTTYQLPFIQRYIEKLSWTSNIPVCPTFKSIRKQEIRV